MSKKQIRKYVYTPGTTVPLVNGTVVIPGYWPLERILLITNLTQGVILFNFADQLNTGGTVSFKPGGVSTTDSSVVSYGYDVNNNVPTNAAKVQSITNSNTGVDTMAGTGETTITFTTVSTVGHSASDSLSILVEDQYQVVRIWSDFGTDAVERTRVAAPQSMIDADFEFGIQATKWGNFQLVNRYPSVYEQVTPDFTVGNVISDGNTPSLITIYSAGHGLSVGNAFTVSQLLTTVSGFSAAQGSFLAISANTNFFSYYAKTISSAVGSAGTNLAIPGTQVRAGAIFTGTTLPVTYLATDGATPSTITLTFSGPHGFVPGMPLLINANPSFGANSMLTNLSGAYYTKQILDSNTASFTARGVVGSAGGNINISAAAATAQITVYTRPDGFFTHRPGDGGVILGTSSPVHGTTAIRQTKKVFRYQSGKGYMYTTGVLFAPNYDITSITAAGTTSGSVITCTTSIPHGLQIGSQVKILGVSTSGYDGTYTITGVVSDYTVQFLVAAGITLGSNTSWIGNPTTGQVNAAPKLFMYKWYGSCLRTGPHDDTNGMFMEYDGQTFNCVKRTSTLQLAGTISVTPGSNYVVGDNYTLWQQQLVIGDKIIIKGMVYRVSAIPTEHLIAVTPAYRGVSATSGNYLWKVQEERASQPQFNYDTVDGSGSLNNPSGYLMDPTRVQMVGIQFTWYGAGFMDFMVRGVDGNYIIIHRMKQNNVNVTASMRSANLPARYAVVNEAGVSVTSIPLGGSYSVPASGATSIPVANASFFPMSGTVMIDNEIFTYSTRTTSAVNGAYQLTISGRATGSLSTSANVSVYTGGGTQTFYGQLSPSLHTSGAGVELIGLTASPTMSHWGSAYIADGGFDFDRGYVYSYSVTNANITSAGTTVMGMRLSPSASNAIPGDLGDRELLNRAQLLLQSITMNCSSKTTQGNVAVLVQGWLNPNNYSVSSQTWTNLNSSAQGNQPSLTQVTAAPVFGGFSSTLPGPGEKIFEFIYDPLQQNFRDLSHIKELSQSAIGGRATYPDGPDTLYVVCTALANASIGATFVSNVHVTLQWNENQA